MRRIVSLATLPVLLLVTTVAEAQRGGGDPAAQRFFSFLDRNRDGRIDGSEAGRMPEPLRNAMRAMRVDARRGISQDQFFQMFPRMMEEMRAMRDRAASEGGSRGGFSRGGDSRSGFSRGDSRGGFSRGGFSRGGDGRGPAAFSRGDRSGWSRGNSGSSRESNKPRRWTPKKRERVTVDLPSQYTEHDKDGDGQIGLHEWVRSKYSEFYALDLNRDGILTPRELTAAKGVESTGGTKTASTSRQDTSGPRTTTSRQTTSTRSSNSGSEKIESVEFDKESSEGRWATFVFSSLDRNKDGTLTADEWQQSRSTRANFERLGVEPPLPAKFDDIAGLFVAVQRKSRGQR